MSNSQPNTDRFGLYLTRFLWCALFLMLTVFTGTTREAFLGAPKVFNQLVTITIVLACCVLRARASDGSSRRLIETFRDAWLKLPMIVIVTAIAWLACLWWSARRSSLPVLSNEIFGFMAWNLLLCALGYGYASGGLEKTKNILTGMLFGLDICIAIGARQFITYWGNPHRDMSYQAQHNTIVALLNDTNHFGLYLAVLLPLALWSAAYAYANPIVNEQDNNIDLRRPLFNLWRGWQLIRPGLVIALGIATTSRSNWASTLGGLVLFFVLQRRYPIRNASLLEPYLPGLLCGLLLSLGIFVLQSDWIRFHLHQTTETAYMSSLGRGTIWHGEIHMIRQRPLTGWGPGTFAINYLQFLQPNQFREPVLEGHNLYLHRATEEGLPSLLCWLGFVLTLWFGGLKRLLGKRHDSDEPLPKDDALRIQILIALTSMLFAYGLCTVFVMPEQTPTITVQFYLALAILAALSQEAARDDKIQRASIFKPAFVHGIMALGAIGFTLYIPTLWRRDKAQLAFDTAVESKSKVERVGLLREALNLDPAQSVYWAQMGYAQYNLLGEGGEATAIGYYKTATERFPNDGVSWHNLAALSYMAGNYESAVRCSRHSVACDPSFYLYHQQLAASYSKLSQGAEADHEQALAAQFSQPPTTNPGIPPTPSGCALIGRYRRVIATPEIILPK